MPASVLNFAKRKSNKVVITRSPNSGATYVGGKSFDLQNLNPTVARFNAFWTLMETIKKHGYLRAAMSVVGRSAIGAWWSLVRHDEFGTSAPERQRKRLYDFYTMRFRSWDNIRDFQSIAYKLLIGVQYLRYFGQVAFHILRDEQGRAVGIDHLPGLVVPNVDSSGKFRSPAFTQYPASDLSQKVEFKNPRDIIFITNPDWEGSPLGGSEIESLTEWTLPLDIYLQTAARDYMKNRNRPELVFSLPSDISDEAFEDFVKEVEARWSGPANIGRNPIAVQGEFKVTELSKLPDALPYQESRKDTRDEALAVAGVSGAKLGLSGSLSSANIRELRREFHETNLVPLFRMVEQAFYEQIHVREFGYFGWEFKFNNPDFLNAVERSTVHLRYRQMGAMSPNEVRADIGKPKRTDSAGDEFEGEEPAQGDDEQIPNPQGNPPEGRPTEPGSPQQTGEPPDDYEAPDRGDQHDDEVRSQIVNELLLWKEFVRRRIRKGRTLREFNSDILPDEVRQVVHAALRTVQSVDDVNRIFDAAILDVEEFFDAEI